ncbi:hypothetical protein N824_11735 [Pedobacter sp. V48]|nr:hypothetical protein N824_11735 [Pedobacter sp. V48]
MTTLKEAKMFENKSAVISTIGQVTVWEGVRDDGVSKIKKMKIFLIPHATF